MRTRKDFLSACEPSEAEVYEQMFCRVESLAQELGDPNRFGTFEKLFEELCARFKIYNAKRIHSALKMPPDTFYELALRERAERISAQNKA